MALFLFFFFFFNHSDVIISAGPFKSKAESLVRQSIRLGVVPPDNRSFEPVLVPSLIVIFFFGVVLGGVGGALPRYLLLSDAGEPSGCRYARAAAADGDERRLYAPPLPQGQWRVLIGFRGEERVHAADGRRNLPPDTVVD